MAVPERVTCPRLEWIAPGRAECPRPDGLVATTHPGCDAGRGVCQAVTPAGSCVSPRRREGLVSGRGAGRVVCPARGDVLAFQETAWKGTLKTVVQRPSPWLTLRLPPSASTRRRAPSRPKPEEKAS